MERAPSPLPKASRAAKRSFFEQLAREHWECMRLLFRGGKLTIDRSDRRWHGYRSTVEHCLAELAAMRELASLLNLNDEDTQKLCTVTVVHDWKRRFELELKQTEKIPDAMERAQGQERIRARLTSAEERFLPKVHPDPDLLLSTTPEFLPVAHSGKASFLQKLQFYIDDIFTGSNIVPLLERIAEVESRRGDLNDDPSKNVGGLRYWDAERKIGMEIEAEIFAHLRRAYEERGEALPIEKPEEIPLLLKRKVSQRIVEHWLHTESRRHMETFRDVDGIESRYFVDVVSDTPRPKTADNEDQGLLRERNGVVLAGVFDGATTIADIPYFRTLGMSPGNVASTVCKGVLRFLPVNVHPKEALLAMNRTLRRVLSALPLSSTEKAELLTMGLVVRQEGRQVQWANVGDTTLVKVGADGTVAFLTTNRLEEYEMEEYRAAAEDAKRLGIPVGDVLKRAGTRCWEVITLNRTRENDPAGRTYGVLKGGDDTALEQYIQHDELELAEGEYLLLITDGCCLPISVPPAERQAFIANALERGIRGLLDEVRMAEKDDPQCDRYLRLKQHDDATGIVIRSQR